jgi:hypothetical protein
MTFLTRVDEYGYPEAMTEQGNKGGNEIGAAGRND